MWMKGQKESSINHSITVWTPQRFQTLQRSQSKKEEVSKREEGIWLWSHVQAEASVSTNSPRLLQQRQSGLTPCERSAQTNSCCRSPTGSRQLLFVQSPSRRDSPKCVYLLTYSTHVWTRLCPPPSPAAGCRHLRHREWEADGGKARVFVLCMWAHVRLRHLFVVSPSLSAPLLRSPSWWVGHVLQEVKATEVISSQRLSFTSNSLNSMCVLNTCRLLNSSLSHKYWYHYCTTLLYLGKRYLNIKSKSTHLQ